LIEKSYLCGNSQLHLLPVLIYYLAVPFIYLLSLLPFPVLYFLSDGLYLLLFHVIGYRKALILENLRNSFPEKTDAEINALCKKFYHYLCDLILEVFKTLTISPSKMLKHCSLDPDAAKLFEQFAQENKSIIIVMGHHGNWEWAGNTFSLCCKHQLYVIYHPITNEYFNNLICKMRTRFGTKLIAMNNTFRDMLQHRNELTATAFIADQTPSAREKAYWMNFLNQDTPVFMGTEKIAQKMKYPIVFVSVKKIKRGYYTVIANTLSLPPLSPVEGQITEAHTHRLEAEILQEPSTWLWSHRRWKHKR
jgi:Kdo2-lipid IVA lauroyltransferase/acyltransferase